MARVVVEPDVVEVARFLDILDDLDDRGGNGTLHVFLALTAAHTSLL